ncbi:hypothetical protein [Pedobacter africanus]|uniref:Uncharacterized protein n=1 Tax=Pedobacter africanus TaxID=151894 RepID=A0A1W2DGM4_9SPHI|nr:hypothetical protein [Pedobacter africanus]SMC96078.1 hypothetical protein SAMN04488524_3734 [Pedobacter africanus]
MNRFIKGVLAFLLPVLVLGIILEVLLRKIPNDYKYKSEYLDQHSTAIQTLYLGNSHIYYGIDPVYLAPNTFNAAYVAQYLNYDLAILQKYNWPALRQIVISVDYLSLYGKLEDGVESWRKKNYIIYYGIHLETEIADHMEVLSQFKNNLHKINNYYFQHDKVITCSALGWGTGYTAKTKNDLDETGKQAAIRHTSKDDRNFNENLQKLKTIIEFAERNKIDVFLITSPAYKTYTDRLNQVQLTRSLNAAKQLAVNYKNVHYFDLLEDPSFTKADFYDADHLNEKGAKKFTYKTDSLIKASVKNQP